jgi:hypothetical protein
MRPKLVKMPCPQPLTIAYELAMLVARVILIIYWVMWLTIWAYLTFCVFAFFTYLFFCYLLKGCFLSFLLFRGLIKIKFIDMALTFPDHEYYFVSFFYCTSLYLLMNKLCTQTKTDNLTGGFVITMVSGSLKVNLSADSTWSGLWS